VVVFAGAAPFVVAGLAAGVTLVTGGVFVVVTDAALVDAGLAAGAFVAFGVAAG
jgi:hypothetical protein